MVKNKATARLCCIFLVWSLSLSLSLSLPSRLGPIKAGTTFLSLADTVHPEGSPGSCRGWTTAGGSWRLLLCFLTLCFSAALCMAFLGRVLEMERRWHVGRFTVASGVLFFPRPPIS